MIYKNIFYFLCFLLLIQQPVFSQSNFSSISIERPSAIAVNSVTGKLYVGNFSNKLFVYDIATLTKTGEVEIGFGHECIAVNETTNKIYIVRAVQPNDTLTVVDGATNSLVTDIPIQNSSGINEIAVNPNLNKIYITTQNPNSVIVINGQTNVVSNTIQLQSTPRNIAINLDNNKGYIAGTSKIYALLPASNGSESISSVDLPSPLTSHGIGVSRGLDSVYSSDTELHIRTGLLAPKEIRKSEHFVGVATDLAVNPNTNKVYLLFNSSSTNSRVVFFNGLTFQIDNVIDFNTVNSNLPEIEVDKTTGKVFVTNRDGNLLYVTDGLQVNPPPSATPTPSTLPTTPLTPLPDTNPIPSPLPSPFEPTSPPTPSSLPTLPTEPIIFDAYDLLDEILFSAEQLAMSVPQTRRHVRRIVISAKRISYILSAQQNSCPILVDPELNRLDSAVSDLYEIDHEGIRDSGIDSFLQDLTSVLITDRDGNEFIDVCEYISESAAPISDSEPLVDQAIIRLNQLISDIRVLGRSVRQTRRLASRIISLANRIKNILSAQESTCSESISIELDRLNTAASDLDLINHEGVRDTNIGGLMYEVNDALEHDSDENGTIDICEE